MSMTKSQKAAEKLAKAKAEFKEAKHAEAELLRKEARRNFTRAARKAGLLHLVAGGAITPEALEVEFRAVAERLKSRAPATASVEQVPPAASGDPASTAGGDEHKPFWKRG